MRTRITLLLASLALALGSAMAAVPAHAAPVGPPQHGGVTLDGFGGLHPFGGLALNSAGQAYWPNWDIARSVAVLPDGSGGWTLDGFGGIHNWGAAPPLVTPSYWPGWDIARALVVFPDQVSGYVLDGWGGTHPFGAAPTLMLASWPGWDIARGLDVRVDAQGNVFGAALLDGWGGVHTVGTYGMTSPPPGYPGRQAYRALHSASGKAYAVGQWGVVTPMDGGLQAYWTGYTDWGSWNITRDLVLFGADNPNPQPQPVSPWAASEALANVGQPYDVGYRPECGIPVSARWAAAQVITVSVPCQSMTAYQNGQVFMNAYVTTARPGFVTPRGWRHILWKRSPWGVLMNFPYGPSRQVRYAMAIDSVGDLFHDADWEPATAYGQLSSLEPPYGSHGCIHVQAWQLGSLFAWTGVGASVFIA